MARKSPRIGEAHHQLKIAIKAIAFRMSRGWQWMVRPLKSTWTMPSWSMRRDAITPGPRHPERFFDGGPRQIYNAYHYLKYPSRSSGRVLDSSALCNRSIAVPCTMFCKQISRTRCLPRLCPQAPMFSSSSPGYAGCSNSCNNIGVIPNSA